MVEPKYLCGLSNNYKIGVSGIVKRIGLAETETIEREEHLDDFNHIQQRFSLHTFF